MSDAASMQALSIEVSHGRLREKLKVPVAANTIGTVDGILDKMISVKVQVMVKDKKKEVSGLFKPAVLEPQKDCRCGAMSFVHVVHE